MAVLRKIVGLVIPLCLLQQGCPLLIPPEFTVSVNRIAESGQEAALIAAAEAACPIREDVVAVFEGEVPPDTGECLWWHGDFISDFRLPYAITGDAVQNYEDQMAAEEAIAVWGVWYFSYTSDVERLEPSETDGQEAYLVSMDMEFYTVCGPLCGYGFSKERFVLLSADGEVLAVGGDGPTQWWIS